MATVGSLVVDLIANTASFVAGMRTARTEVSSTSQAIRSAQGQLGNLSGSANDAASAVESLKSAAAGVEAAGGAAKEFSQGLNSVADSAGRVAGRIDDLKASLESLRSIKASGNIGKAGILAGAFAFLADLAITTETAAQNAAAARTGLAPDSEMNRESARIEAETRRLMARRQKAAEFEASTPMQSLKQQATDIKALSLDAAGAASLRMRESMQDMVRSGQATPADVERLAGLAGEAAEREQELKQLAKDRAEAESVIKDLKEKSVTAGRTEVDAMEDQLRLRKLDGAQLQQALQLSRQIRGKNLAFSLGGQDPQTAFAREMQSIKDAVQFGGLSKDLAKDGIAYATLRLAQSATQTARAPAGLVFGSNQAFSAEGNRQQLSIDLVKQQLGIAQKSLTVQEAIAKGQAAVQAVGVFKIK